mgnify:CR=1 FL=1
MNAYELRKNSRGTRNKKMSFDNVAGFTRSLYQNKMYHSLNDGDEFDSFKNVHAEEIRILEDVKARSYRTGVSSTRIRDIAHIGCHLGKKRCIYHRVCPKDEKKGKIRNHINDDILVAKF